MTTKYDGTFILKKINEKLVRIPIEEINSKNKHLSFKDKNSTIKKEVFDYINNNKDILSDVTKDKPSILYVETSKGYIRYVKIGICNICDEKQTGHEHHIIPEELGGKDFNENKVFVCEKCHDDVELRCEYCLNRTKMTCNKENFRKCWKGGYPSSMKKCNMEEFKMRKKEQIIFDDITKFKCKDCNTKLVRIGLWNKENYLSNEWYSEFLCEKYDKTYTIKMEKEEMNWVVDNIKVVSTENIKLLRTQLKM